jgi:hypothetical protein
MIANIMTNGKRLTQYNRMLTSEAEAMVMRNAERGHP